MKVYVDNDQDSDFTEWGTARTSGTKTTTVKYVGFRFRQHSTYNHSGHYPWVDDFRMRSIGG